MTMARLNLADPVRSARIVDPSMNPVCKCPERLVLNFNSGKHAVEETLHSTLQP